MSIPAYYSNFIKYQNAIYYFTLDTNDSSDQLKHESENEAQLPKQKPSK